MESHWSDTACAAQPMTFRNSIMTTTIQAQVSPSTLSKVSRLFNASLTDCLNELLQNARRAGASAVKITLLDNHHLVIEDDGIGILAPQTLLTLGESHWSEQTQQQEAPAGMGIFSLANRTVTIRSHDWQVQLTPAHFSGEAIASVESCEAIKGTRLSFTITEAETSAFHARVCQLAQFYPLPVWFNGEAIPRQDFLQEAVYVENWHGLRIGLRRKYQWNGTSQINFYGLTLTQMLPSLYCNGVTLCVRVDVVDCPELQLVLPARKEVVQNGFWTALNTCLWTVLYRYVATLPAHDLSHAHWRRARTLGVELQAAQAVLYQFTPTIAYDHERGQAIPVSDRSLLINLDDRACCEQQVFWRAFEQAQLDYEPVAPDYQYVGYSWYDSLSCLTELRFEIEQQGKVIDFEQWQDEVVMTADTAIVGIRTTFRVEQIWAIAQITDSSENHQEIRFACDVLLIEAPELYWDEVERIPVVLSQSADLTVEDLAKLLEASYFSPSEDLEADSVWTQREDFLEMAYERAVKALLTEEAALQERLTMTAERHLRWIVPSNQRLEIQLMPRGINDPVVSVKLIESEEVQ
jgi:Histidine kinase-, DNA gyrase B-, and HSP90-like ATPase